MKLYIAGQITGLAEHIYRRKFSNAEQGLLLLGFGIINPCDLPHKHAPEWKLFMKEDLAALKTCGGVFMLDNWENSRGARLEHWFAKRYHKTIIYQPKKIKL